MSSGSAALNSVIHHHYKLELGAAHRLRNSSSELHVLLITRRWSAAVLQPSCCFRRGSAFRACLSGRTAYTVQHASPLSGLREVKCGRLRARVTRTLQPSLRLCPCIPILIIFVASAQLIFFTPSAAESLLLPNSHFSADDVNDYYNIMMNESYDINVSLLIIGPGLYHILLHHMMSYSRNVLSYDSKPSERA